MPKDEKTDDLLSRLYAQIVRGYSDCVYKSQTVHIKHFGVEDQFLIQHKYDTVFKRAEGQGLPTKEQALKTLIEQELWSAAEDAEIDKQGQYVEGLRQSRKHLIIPSQIEQLSDQLEVGAKELEKLKATKESLLKETCEHFADQRANDYSVYLSFCTNTSLEPLFTEDQFNHLEKPELYELVALYNTAMVPLSTENIKRIAIAPFFVNYFNLTGDNPSCFFKGPVAHLTYYQVNLLNYGRVFKSIFENVADIPDHVADDPDKLLDFAESSKKAQTNRDRAQQADGYSVVGATEGDLKTMGIKDGSTKSIFDMAKEKGGNLGIEDFK